MLTLWSPSVACDWFCSCGLVAKIITYGQNKSWSALNLCIPFKASPVLPIQVTQSLALTPTLSADVYNIFFNLYNCIKWCWKSVCPICQVFLLEAPDTPVHRSWTQLKQVICVKFIMPRLHCHWLRAHQAPPLLPLVVQSGPWEVSGHFCYCSFDLCPS